MKPQKILYVLLLDRARLSQKNEGWADELGRAFIFLPNQRFGRNHAQKAKCLSRPLWQFWKKTDLIFRKRQGPGLPNKIYVKSPTGISGADGQKSFPDTDRKLSF